MKAKTPHLQSKPELLISSVGFKLTPALLRKTTQSLASLRKKGMGIVRIRAKLKFFDNGPRRDTFEVRMRLEKRGPDLVTVQNGHNLYPLIQQAADITLGRLREKTNKRLTARRRQHIKSKWGLVKA